MNITFLLAAFLLAANAAHPPEFSEGTVRTFHAVQQLHTIAADIAEQARPEGINVYSGRKWASGARQTAQGVCLMLLSEHHDVGDFALATPWGCRTFLKRSLLGFADRDKDIRAYVFNALRKRVGLAFVKSEGEIFGSSTYFHDGTPIEKADLDGLRGTAACVWNKGHEGTSGSPSIYHITTIGGDPVPEAVFLAHDKFRSSDTVTEEWRALSAQYPETKL